VHPSVQRRGVGAALLRHAIALSPAGIELHTHVRNAKARAFYEKHHLVAVKFGVSPPPESEPDVEYHWRPDIARCLRLRRAAALNSAVVLCAGTAPREPAARAAGERAQPSLARHSSRRCRRHAARTATCGARAASEASRSRIAEVKRVAKARRPLAFVAGAALARRKIVRSRSATTSLRRAATAARARPGRRRRAPARRRPRASRRPRHSRAAARASRAARRASRRARARRAPASRRPRPCDSRARRAAARARFSDSVPTPAPTLAASGLLL
jgi:hypothetical protein